jgi:hypothetical protein
MRDTISRTQKKVMRRRTVMALVVAGAVTTSAVVASGNGPADNSRAVDALHNSANVSGPHGEVKAWGLDPAQASPAFRTPSAAVAVVRDSGAACLVLSTEEDQCYTQANIAGGRGFSITNDCSVGSKRSMVIEGFTPNADAASVQVRYSDGSVPLKGAVVDEAYRIEGRTPSGGKAYPVALMYVSATGAALGSQEIVGGDDLCIRGQRAPS